MENGDRGEGAFASLAAAFQHLALIRPSQSGMFRLTPLVASPGEHGTSSSLQTRAIPSWSTCIVPKHPKNVP